MYKADKLYDQMMEVKDTAEKMEVRDEKSLAEYFRLYTELVYNHKWIGSIYDIYADDAKIYRENGVLINGVHEIMRDALQLTAAFPDMQLEIRDVFAVKKSDTCYKLWRYFSMKGTNTCYSKYGPATGKALNSDACIAMSMATVEYISGRWQIVRDFTMYSIDSIAETCRTVEA